FTKGCALRTHGFHGFCGISHACPVVLKLVLVINKHTVKGGSDDVQVHIDHVELSNARPDGVPFMTGCQVYVDPEVTRVRVVIESGYEFARPRHQQGRTRGWVEGSTGARTELPRALENPPPVDVLSQVAAGHNPVRLSVPFPVSRHHEVTGLQGARFRIGTPSLGRLPVVGCS